jgi:hypothetical protein
MTRRSPRDDSTKVVLIVVASIVGVLLIVALACGGAVYILTRTVSKSFDKTIARVSAEIEKAQASLEAETAAESFLVDLSLNQADHAYASTTRAFQGRRTAAEFRTYLDQHPLLKRIDNVRQPMMPLPPAVNDRVAVRFVFNGNQATVVILDMLKEDGAWKVDEVTAP